MRKKVDGKNVFYTIAWTPLVPYDRFNASRFLPELPGIAEIIGIQGSEEKTLMFLECWREGLRSGLKGLLEADSPAFRDIRRKLNEYDLVFRFTEVTSSPHDMKDIMYWLIQETLPPFNNADGFSDTGRYRSINVKEINRSGEDVIERIPPYR